MQSRFNHHLRRLMKAGVNHLEAGITQSARDNFGAAVVTVEPGLYYPGIGGCRIEDVVQVTDAAPKLLSRYSYDWEF